jgi:type IV pilus assembly protein PilC
MPTFSFLAKSLKGEEKTGFIEATDQRQLALILKEQGFLLIKAEAKKEGISQNKIDFSLFEGGISLSDKMMFTRNLQVMISSGLNLPKALQTLAKQTKSSKFRKALIDISDQITKGKNFSESLKGYPEIFSELFQNMIKVGEETGGLDNALAILSRQMEREYELKSKIKSALIYPAVIIFSMLGIGVLMLIMVVPKLSQTFNELGVELPMSTKIVIGIGNFLAQNWLFFILIVVFFCVLFFFFSKKPKSKKILDFISLKVPTVSSLIKKTNSAYTIRTLSSLIAAGVPIVKSLEIVSGSLDNSYYKEAILDVAEKVRKGGKLSSAFDSHQDIYPLLVLQMLQVGEETGESSNILGRLADFFEEDINNETKNLVSVIEPVLMLVIGVTIGFFAISMVQPMYSMLGSI